MSIFKSVWITTKDFINEKKPELFHKELEEIEIRPHKKELMNYHAVFGRKFKADTHKKYNMRISADDYYKLYINGRCIGRGPGMAYPGNYSYNEYDISEYLKDGDNEILVHVYYQGLINRVWVSGDCRMGMIADILENGLCVLGTDEAWSCRRITYYTGMETTGYETQFLENIDFRLEKYSAAEVCADPADDHVFRGDAAPAVCVYDFKGATQRRGEGFFEADTGQEIAAALEFSVSGKRGQRVYIRCGEEKDSDGHVRFDMRCNCRYEECLILSGGKDSFSGYDYKAFRYVEIVSELPFEIENFKIMARHYPFRLRARLRPNAEPLLAGIWELCANTLKYSTQEAFLDCPTREKGQYLGDFTVSGLAYMHLTGDTRLYRRTLYNFADTAGICEGLMADAGCSFMQEIADFSLMYPLQIYNYFKYTGDRETVRSLIPAAERMTEHFKRYEREDSLLAGVTDKWNLVDWPQTCRDGYDAELERPIRGNICHNVINAYYAGAHIMLDKLKEAAGIEPDREKTKRLTDAFNREFYCAETGLYKDTGKSKHSALHSNVLPLFFGFAPEGAERAIGDFIVKKGFSCGVFFAYFTLKALTGIGYKKEAYALLCSDSRHSWSNMLREGATTAFEAWGKDQKENTSLCHPWACAPIIIISEDFPELAVFGDC